MGTERVVADDRRMRTIALIMAGALVVIGSALAAEATPTPVEYSLAVTHICANALLFDGRHQIGTRVGAVAVSHDIRATGGRRLREVDAVPKPAETAVLAGRWIAIEQRLVEMYSSTYLQIWDEIEAEYDSPRKHAHLAAVLQALVRRPDGLQRRAAALEQRLRVPDCTGGQPRIAPATAPAGA